MAELEKKQPNLFANNSRIDYANQQMMESQAPLDTAQEAKTTNAQATPVVNRTTQYKPIDEKSSTDGVDFINSLYTTPKKEEEYRKASVQRQRINAVADALRHIGNIYHTTKYAPSQQFNSPVEQERTRYLQEKALRDQNNMKFMTYQQAKAAQDAKAKQWEADYNLKVANAARQAGLTAAQIKNMQDKLAQDKAYKDATIAFNKDKWAQQADLNERKFKQQTAHQNRMAGIAGMNAQTNRQKATAYINHLNNGGGRGGGGSQYRFATQKGKGYIEMPKNFTQAQKDQVIAMFPQYRNQSEIARQMAQLGLNTNDPAQVRNYQFAQMLLEHPEVEDFVVNTMGAKSYGGGYMQPSAASQPSGMNGFIAPGNTWSTPGGNSDWSQYLVGSAGSSDDDFVDYADEEDDWDQYAY